MISLLPGALELVVQWLGLLFIAAVVLLAGGLIVLLAFAGLRPRPRRGALIR